MPGEWVERREGEWALRVPYAGLEPILADLYALITGVGASALELRDTLERGRVFPLVTAEEARYVALSMPVPRP